MRAERGFPAAAFVFTLVGAVMLYAQSLKETTDSLRDLLAVEANVASGDWRDRFRLTASDCELTILHENEDMRCTKLENDAVCDDWPHSITYTSRQVFNLNDIDATRMTVETEPTGRIWIVEMPTANDRPAVTHTVKVGDAFQPAEKPESPRHAFVAVRSRDAADRVASAFRSGVALCAARR
jgi:hypothetical protein